jgi:hypothetical protein
MTHIYEQINNYCAYINIQSINRRSLKNEQKNLKRFFQICAVTSTRTSPLPRAPAFPPDLLPVFPTANHRALSSMIVLRGAGKAPVVGAFKPLGGHHETYHTL